MDGTRARRVVFVAILFFVLGREGTALADGDDPASTLRRELAARLGGAPEGKPDPEELLRLAAVHGIVEPAGAGFYLVGVSALPARAVLSVTLEYEKRTIETRRAVVEEEGAFECLLGPYGDQRVFQGVYTLRVSYDPQRQPVSVQGHPGTPIETRSRSVEVRVGDEAGEAAEREVQRLAYLEYVKEIDRHAAAEETEAKAAALKEKYTIGAKKDFDELSWRRWASDWRESLDRKVTRELLDWRDEEVLAPLLPDALQAVLTLASYYQEIHKIDSREIYEHHGRAVAPEDRVAEGGALLSRLAVLQQIEAARKRLETLLAAPGEDGEEGGEPGADGNAKPGTGEDGG